MGRGRGRVERNSATVHPAKSAQMTASPLRNACDADAVLNRCSKSTVTQWLAAVAARKLPIVEISILSLCFPPERCVFLLL